MQIERLSAKDFEEAIDFINMVFSVEHGVFNFEKILPRLYRPTEECMRCNIVVRDNGKIRALVGLYPDIIHVGDTTLKLGGIGAVSCHPNDRGKGWMKLLMNQQINEMKREGYDLSFLGGQRQRYMYYGYEKTGTMLEYRINKSNLKHEPNAGSLTEIKFEPLNATNLSRIKRAKELHDSQPLYCQRPIEEFYLFLLTWQSKPWAAIDRDGNMVGYLVSNPEQNRISEIFAENATAFSCMVRSWCMQQNAREVAFTMPSWAKESCRYLGCIAEDVQVNGNCNWNILNWQKVIGALLRVKNATNQLAEGTLNIGIKEYGIIKICLQVKLITCEITSEQPDVEWEPLTAMRVVLGHISSSLVTEIPKTAEPVIGSWFPLPLSWLPMNHV